jgi:hypothetical protein
VRIKLGVYLFLIFSFTAACERESIAKKSVDSIPIESMDAETGGKKGGDTHFSISSDELFFDYEYFDNEAGAKAKLDERRRKAKQIIEEGNVLGKGGEIAAEYSVTENVSTYENERYCLRWSRANRYLQVCSSSRHAIEEFRTVYDL